jgi:D-glycero-alpha-D-manno-heptose 1-phosphate guanylyltransferase
MKFDVVILAGGLGTRLQSVVSDVPKPMAPIGDKPFLDYLLDQLPLANISQLVMAVGHKYEVIEKHYGDNFNDVKVVYSVENEPLGTGGAIKQALAECTEEHVLIVNGDTFFDIDFEQMLQHHFYAKSALTIALKMIVQPDRYGTVLLENDRIVKFSEKTPGLSQGLINGGIYLMNLGLASLLPNKEKFSFETDFLQIKTQDIALGGYLDEGEFIDIGIPEDYARAQEYLTSL